MQTTDSMNTGLLLSQLAQLPITTFETQAKLLIDAAEANIARINSQIRDLECLRDRERGVIARLRMAIAPVNKLPAELLREIFLHVRCQSSYYRRDTVQKVQRLSHVCVYWRRVAHTTPRLFTETVSFKLEKTPSEDYLALSKHWLDRSSPFPISIHLENSGTNWRRVNAGPLMDIMAANAHRWDSARFHLSSLDVFDRIHAVSLNSLHTFDLKSSDVKNHELTRPLLTAERLQTLFLHTQRSSKFVLPWAQITTLRVEDHHPMECLDALVQCASVVDADLRTSAWPELPDMSQRPITTLSGLETLSIDFGSDCQSGDLTGPFFTHLSLPALKRLTVCMDMDHFWSSPDFTEFQLRSPKIEHLAIERSGLVPSDLLAVFQHAPSLVILDLDCCQHCLDDSIVTGLQHSSTHGPSLAPRLETINMSYTGSDFNEDALDTMIQSRWWTDEQLLALPCPPPVSRWSCISIHCSDDENDGFSPHIAAKLELYRSQGLDVTVSGFGSEEY
ncbi:hypothetical protein R3P38DRAFT_2957362 [Favolaschia claudopus]|uniref:F-box domain-containing protein n=1 Tax=Favolaschia claudopus TaxID=2862362 RepID=A0AAW0BDH4_9AGAR